MKRYVCSICGFVYDEAVGHEASALAPGTLWDDIPNSWVCPLCKATKAMFNPQEETKKKVRRSNSTEAITTGPLSAGALSALFSNLAKGCEKQYRNEEATWFHELSEYYETKVTTILTEDLQADFSTLNKLVQNDLDILLASAADFATEASDRGSLRAYTWGDKVTRMISSLLSRYEQEKSALLLSTTMYVCEICGFIYIGDQAPEICPVCKVPSMKITAVERR
ncbi:MAG: rubredoxin [Vallitaleaceae bacterium]|nr:rubredoxin [Vallitaleaceae bacterium]